MLSTMMAYLTNPALAPTLLLIHYRNDMFPVTQYTTLARRIFSPAPVCLPPFLFLPCLSFAARKATPGAPAPPPPPPPQE